MGQENRLLPHCREAPQLLKSERRAVAFACAGAYHRIHRADQVLAISDLAGAWGISSRSRHLLPGADYVTLAKKLHQVRPRECSFREKFPRHIPVEKFGLKQGQPSRNAGGLGVFLSDWAVMDPLPLRYTWAENALGLLAQIDNILTDLGTYFYFSFPLVTMRPLCLFASESRSSVHTLSGNPVKSSSRLTVKPRQSKSA